MRVPKYRKHSTRDYAFVEWRGRRHPLPGRHGSDTSKNAYQRFLREHVVTDPDRLAAPAATVQGVVRYFMVHAEQHYPAGAKSERANCHYAAKVLLDFHRTTPVADFGPTALKSIQRSMAEAKHSRTYINSTVNRIKRMFRWAASEELIPAQVSHALDTVDGLRVGRTEAIEPEPVQPVPWEHVAPVVHYLMPPVRAMLMLQFYTGVRSKTLCNARREQFSLGDPLWIWRPRHKTEHLGHSLVVYIGPRCQHILLPFLTRDGYLFTPQDVRRDRRYRDHYDSASYGTAIYRAQKKAGVPHWCPHQLRHSLGTTVREKYGVEAAQAVLGHASLSATEIYAEKRSGLAAQVAMDLG